MSDNTAACVVVCVIILTIGGCLGNAIHQEEKTKQLRIELNESAKCKCIEEEG
jgi:hypothetical protein